MFDLLQIAVDSSISYGAKYSDARILISQSRSISVKNGDVENFNEAEKLFHVAFSSNSFFTVDLDKHVKLPNLIDCPANAKVRNL